MAFIVRRKLGEKIELFTDGKLVAIVSVNAINGGNVELAFDAGDDLEIIRVDDRAEESLP